jgi:leucyl-tRNA synthetase
LEKEEAIDEVVYKTFLVILAPFAPHLTDELWEDLGEKETIHKESWPGYDDDVLKSASVTIAVQVNGKTRGTFEIAQDAPEEKLIEEAKGVGSVQAHLEGKEIIKEFVVPNRLVNFVVA